jgi:hypothetical protein
VGSPVSSGGGGGRRWCSPGHESWSHFRESMKTKPEWLCCVLLPVLRSKWTTLSYPLENARGKAGKRKKCPTVCVIEARGFIGAPSGDGCRISRHATRGERHLHAYI